MLTTTALTLAAALPVPDAWLRQVLAGPLDGGLKPDLSWFEENAHILFPLLGIGVIALLAIGIYTAWKSDEIAGNLKVEYKREIITILRRVPGGVGVAALAKELKLSIPKTARLLEEMVADRHIVDFEHKGRTHVRLRL